MTVLPPRQTPSLLTAKSRPRPQEGGISLENPLSSRVGLGTYQGGALKRPPSGVLMEAGPAFLMVARPGRPKPVLTHQSNAENSTCEEHQERVHRAPQNHTNMKCVPKF